MSKVIGAVGKAAGGLFSTGSDGTKPATTQKQKREMHMYGRTLDSGPAGTAAPSAPTTKTGSDPRGQKITPRVSSGSSSSRSGSSSSFSAPSQEIRFIQAPGFAAPSAPRAEPSAQIQARAAETAEAAQMRRLSAAQGETGVTSRMQGQEERRLGAATVLGRRGQGGQTSSRRKHLSGY